MKNKTRLLLLFCVTTFLIPLFSSGQDVNIPANKNIPVHHETLDDQYLPNAWDNKKTSPAYNYKSTVSSRTTGSSIFTIQVNVDSNGLNILGDAANEPNIALNPLNANEIVIGWRQFDNVSSNFRQAGWAYTSNAGQKWTFPGKINAGIFQSDPVLDYDADGNFYYNSLASNFDCTVFKSTNGGATWNNGTPAGGGDKEWMTIDRTSGEGRGNIYSFWTAVYSTCMPGFFTRSTNDDSSFESCTIADGAPFLGTMAVDNAGDLYICGADTASYNLVVAKSLNAQVRGSLISWNNPVSVFMDGAITVGSSNINPVGLLGQANIGVDRSGGAGAGNVYVLASMFRLSTGDPGDIMFAKSSDGGLTWSSPIQINDDTLGFNTQWFGTMSVAPNGRIDAVWLDNRDDPTGGDSSALYYSYSVDGGNSWSVNEKLSDLFNPHVGYPNQNKMGDYFDMESDNLGAHLAWANTLNGEEDVYYSYIIPPITTGVKEITDNMTVSVFPNPSSGSFTVKGIKNPSQIEIYNTLGEKIYSATTIKTINEIDISSQSSGIYFLKIINRDGSTAVKKIIKE